MLKGRFILIWAIVTILAGCNDKPSTMDYLPPVLGSISVTPYTTYAILKCDIEGDTESVISCGFEINTVQSDSSAIQISGHLQDNFLTASANNLTPKTDYVVTAFIDNGQSRIYSESVSFTTAEIPVDDYCHFEDELFEKFILSKCDNNKDGKVSKEEALFVFDLDMLPKEIWSLKGVEYLKNVQELTCDGCQLTYLDVSCNENLAYLDCSYCQLDSIKITGLSKLNRFHCNNNNLTGIDFTGCSSLSWIICCSNHISILDITPCNKEIRNLHCAPMNDADGNNLLKTIYVLSDQSVPLNQLPNQTSVVVIGN